MISVQDGQRWVCERTRRAGMIIDIRGRYVSAGPDFLLYANVTSSKRVTGKISVHELRRNWRLMSCAHKDLADECVRCACAFHGTSACDCVAEVRA